MARPYQADTWRKDSPPFQRVMVHPGSIGVLPPGFPTAPPFAEYSQAQPPNMLNHGGGTGSQDSWVLSLDLGGEWGLWLEPGGWESGLAVCKFQLSPSSSSVPQFPLGVPGR
ncbi:unnamed protein product [Natator depressus]